MAKILKTSLNTGKRFMLGAPPGRIGNEAYNLLKETGASVLLLFRSNFIEPDKLAEDLKKLRKKFNKPIVIAVDHETGQVLRDVVYTTVLPGNRALGIIALKSELNDALNFAGISGYIMGTELASMGIGWNLAPVLDVLGEKYNPGIMLRSFGNNPEIVAKLAIATINGLHESGILACAKHFPGLGEAEVDPHYNLPVININPSRLAEIHLYPFREVIKQNIDSIMTSHILFPQLDEKYSVTFSRKIATELLRKELKYQGVLISDDMEMGAITNRSSISQACVDAALAGHDMLIIGQKAVNNALETINYMNNALDNGMINVEEHLLSLERIDNILTRGDILRILDKKSKLKNFTEQNLSPKRPQKQTFFSIAKKISEKSVLLLRDPKKLLPLKKDIKVRIFIPDIVPISNWTLFEDPWFDTHAIANLLITKNKFSCITVPLDDSMDLFRTLSVINPDTVDILVLFNATGKTGQRQLLDFLSKESTKLIVIIVHNFWDLKLIHENITVIDTSGFRLSQLKAAAKIINGTLKFSII